jgi:hypothetical protein
VFILDLTFGPKRFRQKWNITRVTRLGEFSPIGRLFSFASILKITEVAQVLGLLFSKVPVSINLDKKLDGLHFGRLFQKLIWSPCITKSTPGAGSVAEGGSADGTAELEANSAAHGSGLEGCSSVDF